MSKGRYQTLHGHTTDSDGKMTHLEVMEKCEKYNVGTYAFTDHDGLPSERIVKQLKSYSGPTDWIIGIEISSGLPKELGKKGGQHIVGLFVDPFDKVLLEHCRKAQNARVERMRKTVKNLRNLGFDISADDCIKVSGGETVGSPHIVEALKSKDSNQKVLDKLRNEMKSKAKENEKIQEKYEQMLKRGEGSYPYDLFLKSNAFIKGVYVDYLYKVDLDHSVKLIRDAGGVSILAHWFTGKKVLSPEILDGLFKDNRLDGAETVYGVWSKGAITKDELDTDRRVLKKILKKYDKAESGGCDIHREKDLEVLEQTEWYAELTVGLSEGLIQKTGVDTTWSSLGKH